MDRSNVITLVKQTYDKDVIGQVISKESERQVFCNIASVSGSEWMEAGRNGIKPEYQVTMFRYDYEGELIAVLDGVRYGVYRTYMAQGENIELYLEKKAGV